MNNDRLDDPRDEWEDRLRTDLDPEPAPDDMAMLRSWSCWFIGLVIAVCILYSLVEALGSKP